MRSFPHGHVAAVLGSLRKLGLHSLIARPASRDRDLVVAMIVARIIDARSKLATARGLNPESAVSSLGHLLTLDTVDENELYAAMDWLLARQRGIEQRLAKRHLHDNTLMLYDLTSSYFEGHTCPLARRGHSRDGKRGTLQIVFGLLCTADGCPIAVEVFEGSTGDPKTVAAQVDKIRNRLPVTIELGVMAIVIGLAIALPVGIYSAILQDTAADYAARSAAILGLATPNFWLALMVMLFPAIWWGWSPPLELVPFTEDPLGNLGVFIIPSLILGTAMAAATMRMTRTMMLEVLRQDYIRTAWSKGLKERVVVMRHAIKNALIPVVTLIGLQLPILVGGSVIMENIFNLPGLGRLMLLALNDRDYPVVSGINLFFGTAVVLFNLLIDLIYPFFDPRVRYQ